MARAMNLGMPRIGPARELKRAVEGYWSGAVDAGALVAAAQARRVDGWHSQVEAGIDEIPSNDFSLYDGMLDTCCLVGAVPDRFGFEGSGGAEVPLDTYFAMARGGDGGAGPVAPLEMTKWFDTNYHYLVPELGPGSRFGRSSDKPVTELREAQALGIRTRPVLIGPVTFLKLSTSTAKGFDPLVLLERLLPVYRDVLGDLAAAGAEWIQLDEPCLVTDLDTAARAAYREAYTALSTACDARLLLATYFGSLGDNTTLAASLPVDGIHVDAVRAPEQVEPLVAKIGDDRVVSAGVVDGRNIWRTDLRRRLADLDRLHESLGDRLWIGPSSSLLHVPHDLELETELDGEVRGWLAFARQKLAELATLARGVNDGPGAVGEQLLASDAAVAARTTSALIRSGPVRLRTEHVTAEDARRRSPYPVRAAAQREAVDLPPLPTTTIGSFPQTSEIRRARRLHAAGDLDDDGYRAFCEAEITSVITEQEAIGLDVLVHGEPERNDMVQYFGERLDGFVASTHGWVQSYGTRCVRPPILFGDVSRPAPLTVDWFRFAQSKTTRPVKGMLTGPVTIVLWSFVRDDQPLAETCRQLALAIRDEVTDLSAAGAQLIQVDEPALREGLPLRSADRERYLAWATDCFRLATAGVDDATQIHTHMCYAEFGDIVDAIVALDADVISIEAARSGMAVLDALAAAGYPAAVGPGVYDIHSPQVPSEEETAELISRALAAFTPEQLWINPDCGLKTRSWDEVRPALANMVAATRAAREQLHAAAR